MVFIYVLKLEEGKYYVGKTDNPDIRIESHFSDSGAAWTKKYKPVSVIKIIHDCDDYDEDKYTLQFMGQYGMDNVRGGSFCQIELSDQNWTTLVQMLHGATNRCYHCGGGHLIQECPKERLNKERQAKEQQNKERQAKEDTKDRDKEKTKDQEYVVIPRAYSAYKTEIEYYNESCDCIASYFPHRRGKCLLNNIITLVEDEIDNKCYRCGRYGHYEKRCYARYHAKGYGL